MAVLSGHGMGHHLRFKLVDRPLDLFAPDFNAGLLAEIRMRKSTVSHSRSPWVSALITRFDLLGGADFDHEILDSEAAADIILERLRDAGFKIVPA
jgi:hypothetical protein